MPHGLTRHHVIAQQWGGTWHEDNLVRLTRPTHDAVHSLFGNDLPIEILRGVTEKYRTALGRETYELVNGVLVQVEGVMEAYNPKCYRPDRLAEYLSNKLGK